MTYNFTDEPAPVLPSAFDAAGALHLVDGTPQGDLITEAFTGSSVSVTIAPPRGWQLDSVAWSGGGSGIFPIPQPDVEETHPFTYTVSNGSTSLTDQGTFKIKKQGNGGSSGL